MTQLLKKLGYASLLGMLSLYAYVMATGPRGIPALLERQQRIEGLQGANDEMMRDNERRRNWVRQLENDRETQQLEILKRMNKKLPGTQPFFISPEPTTPAPQQ